MIKQTFTVTIRTSSGGINPDNIQVVIENALIRIGYVNPKITVTEGKSKSVARYMVCKKHNEQDCERCSVLEL